MLLRDFVRRFTYRHTVYGEGWIVYQGRGHANVVRDRVPLGFTSVEIAHNQRVFCEAWKSDRDQTIIYQCGWTVFVSKHTQTSHFVSELGVLKRLLNEYTFTPEGALRAILPSVP